MSHRFFPCYGGQSPRYDDFDNIFPERNRLIYSVNNNIKTYGNGFDGSNFNGSSGSTFASRLGRGFEAYREFNSIYGNNMDKKIAELHSSCANIGNFNFTAPIVSSNRQELSTNVHNFALNPYSFSDLGNTADKPFISSSFINKLKKSIDPVTKRTNLHFYRSSVMAGDGAVGDGGGGDGGDVDQVQTVVYPTLTNDNVNYGGHGDGNEHKNVTIFNKVSTNLFNRHRRHNALLTELRTAKNTTDCPSKPNAWPKHIENNVARPYFYKCPICLNSVEWRRPLATNCGHVFCSECLSIALALTHTCPVCKIRVSTRRIFRIYI